MIYQTCFHPTKIMSVMLNPQNEHKVHYKYNNTEAFEKEYPSTVWDLIIQSYKIVYLMNISYRGDTVSSRVLLTFSYNRKINWLTDRDISSFVMKRNLNLYSKSKARKGHHSTVHPYFMLLSFVVCAVALVLLRTCVLNFKLRANCGVGEGMFMFDVHMYILFYLKKFSSSY